ncbi:MAG: TetR family transcriptional regulator [Gammaproteobacteria bacterium]|nr:TetR family transcriptional regulator [Gammaproteobacteria bacterium]
MARRTKKEALETRNRILDTAERVFLKKGVARSSLADVADAAGVTRGAIYWHFKNKADLFEAMMDRVSLPMEAMVARAGDADIADPLAYVRRCALAVLERVTTDPQSRRVAEISRYKVEYADEMEPLRARHIECRTECLGSIERGLRNAAKKGLLARSVNPRLAAVGLHALVDGLITNWVLDTKYLPLARTAKPLIDSYIDGLKSNGQNMRRRQVNKRR